MVPPNITRLDARKLKTQPPTTVGKRLPRLRQLTGIGWRGEDVHKYLNNVRINLETFHKKPLKGLIDSFFTRSSPKVRERIYSKYKSKFGISEEKITPGILNAVRTKIRPDRRYTIKDIKDVFRSVIEESAKAKEKATAKVELMGLLNILLEKEILPYQIKVVIEERIIPAFSDLIIPTDTKISELRSTLIDIKKGKPVNRTKIERIIHGLRGIVESLPYEQKTDFYEMVKEANDGGRTIEFLEEAYRLGILYECARKTPILSIEQWISLRSTFVNNTPFKNAIQNKISTLKAAQQFILGYQTLRISDLEDFLTVKKRIEKVTLRRLHTDLDTDIEGNIRRTINSIIEAGRTAEQIQNNISEINRHGAKKHLDEFKDELNFLEKNLNSEQKQIIRNAIIDSGPAAISALTKASEGVPRRILLPLIAEIIEAVRNTEQEKEAYRALIEIVKVGLDPDDLRIKLATEILLDSKCPEAVYYLLTEYAARYDQARIAHLPVIGRISTLLYKILKSLLNLIIKLLTERPQEQRAIAILRFLKEQVVSEKINLPNSLLNLVINYLSETKASSATVNNLMEIYDSRLKDNLKTDSDPASEVLRDLGITRDIFIQSIQILSIMEFLEAEQFEEARRSAQNAAVFAKKRNFGSDIAYIPGFVAYSLGNEPKDKALDELKTALRADRGKGLFAAMGVVQNILKDETYTNLGNIILDLEPENLEPRVVVYGTLLRSNKFSYERAKIILNEMEKDRKFWLDLIDLISTRQFEKAYKRIKSWLKENLS